MVSMLRVCVFLVSIVGFSGLGCGESSDESAAANDEATSSADDASGTAEPVGDFTLSSSAFGEGDTVPVAQICSRDGGLELSPPIAWANVPVGTQGFALGMFHYPNGTVEGEDAPSHYWLVWNIPASSLGLDEGNPESVGDEGSNKDGVEIGYTAPCSPGDAVHEYTIR
ncbi:uncharacterized protein METZ01_LOCUS462893, partial [marine metagenome]